MSRVCKVIPKRSNESNFSLLDFSAKLHLTSERFYLLHLASHDLNRMPHSPSILSIGFSSFWKHESVLQRFIVNPH